MTAYLLDTALMTLRQLGIMIGPMVLVAFLMQWLSLSHRMFYARGVGFQFYLLLTGAGVIIHEFCHALVCVLFRHKITEVAWFQPAGGHLGHVAHQYDPNSLYQRIGNFFIGSAPVWLGAIIVYGLLLLGFGWEMVSTPLEDLSWGAWLDMLWVQIQIWLHPQYLLQTFDTSRPLVIQIFCGYLIFCTAHHMTLSLADIKGAVSGFLFFAIGMYIINLSLVWVWPEFELVWLWIINQMIFIYPLMLLTFALQIVLFSLALLSFGIRKLFSFFKR